MTGSPVADKKFDYEPPFRDGEALGASTEPHASGHWTTEPQTTVVPQTLTTQIGGTSIDELLVPNTSCEYACLPQPAAVYQIGNVQEQTTSYSYGLFYPQTVQDSPFTCDTPDNLGQNVQYTPYQHEYEQPSGLWPQSANEEQGYWIHHNSHEQTTPAPYPEFGMWQQLDNDAVGLETNDYNEDLSFIDEMLRREIPATPAVGVSLDERSSEAAAPHGPNGLRRYLSQQPSDDDISPTDEEYTHLADGSDSEDRDSEDRLPTIISSDDDSESVPSKNICIDASRVLSKKQPFWLYGTQRKGPKGKTFDIQMEYGGSPHDPLNYNDPVFEKAYKDDVTHHGRTRRGDSTDISPQPYQLAKMGEEITRLSEAMDTNSEKSAKRDINSASQINRLRQKAGHEANKILFEGLEMERSGLIHAIRLLKDMIQTYQQSMDIICYHDEYKRITSECLKTQVDGRRIEYVNGQLARYFMS